jgi:hypothetical protein
MSPWWKSKAISNMPRADAVLTEAEVRLNGVIPHQSKDAERCNYGAGAKVGVGASRMTKDEFQPSSFGWQEPRQD